jgi:hypothetical protein
MLNMTIEERIDKINKINRIGKICFAILSIASVIIIIIFTIIIVKLGKSVSTKSNNSYQNDSSDWLPTEYSVTMMNKTRGKWHWNYIGKLSRTSIQVCGYLTHNSVYQVGNSLVAYMDNKKTSSNLRDYKGDVIYSIDHVYDQHIIINGIETKVKYIIKKECPVGYVLDETFEIKNFNIKDMNGNIMISLKRNKEFDWIFTRTENNTLPLSLPIGLASELSFNEYNETDIDGCNYLYMSSIYIIISFSAIAAISFVGWLLYYRN